MSRQAMSLSEAFSQVARAIEAGATQRERDDAQKGLAEGMRAASRGIGRCREPREAPAAETNLDRAT